MEKPRRYILTANREDGILAFDPREVMIMSWKNQHKNLELVFRSGASVQLHEKVSQKVWEGLINLEVP